MKFFLCYLNIQTVIENDDSCMAGVIFSLIKLLFFKDVTRKLHNKAGPSTNDSDKLSCYEFTRNSDLKKTLSHVEEKFTSAAEELQAAEEELAELRVDLNKARLTIKVLRMENAVFLAVW